MVAALAAAAVAVSGEDFATCSGRDGGCVALPWLLNPRVAVCGFSLGLAEFDFTFWCGYSCAGAGRAFVHVDLAVRAGCPPGGNIVGT